MENDNFNDVVKSFDKFVDLSEALEKQNSIMQDESKAYLESHYCPLIKEDCIKMKCAWYIMCLNNNMKAFKQFFQ